MALLRRLSAHPKKYRRSQAQDRHTPRRPLPPPTTWACCLSVAPAAALCRLGTHTTLYVSVCPCIYAMYVCTYLTVGGSVKPHSSPLTLSTSTNLHAHTHIHTHIPKHHQVPSQPSPGSPHAHNPHNPRLMSPHHGATHHSDGHTLGALISWLLSWLR